MAFLWRRVRFIIENYYFFLSFHPLNYIFTDVSSKTLKIIALIPHKFIRHLIISIIILYRKKKFHTKMYLVQTIIVLYNVLSDRYLGANQLFTVIITA